MSTVMRCKLVLNSKQPCMGDREGFTYRFGAVWEGSTEKQQASENAVFGHYTPYAEFNCSIFNDHVNEQLEVGKAYYVDFSEAPN